VSKLGDLLKAARNRAELSQREAAAKVGLSRSTIVRAENGDVIPAQSTLTLLAEAYGLEPDYFCTARYGALQESGRVQAAPPLGTRLRKARELAGLSTKEVAKLCGVSNWSICDYENGRTKPSEKRLEKLKSIYGISGSCPFSRFKAGDIIKGKSTKNIQWRVLNVRSDGTLDVEKVIEPPRKIIKRPEFYQVV